jgi:tripartite-type tricarboxylate transporter receptor subunit TctC
LEADRVVPGGSACHKRSLPVFCGAYATPVSDKDWVRARSGSSQQQGCTLMQGEETMSKTERQGASRNIHHHVKAKILVAAGIAASFLIATPNRAGAQKYPDYPVRVVVPFAAGGVADITVRVVTEKLGDKLGQRFVIENQPGAGGIAAARSVKSAAPDGYTLALLSNGTAVSVPLFKSLPFDPLKDFAPISSLGYFDFFFFANAESQYRTLGDFVKAAREKPGKLNVATINIGSTQNLSAELFKSTAGLDFAIVPFRTTPEALISLLRNDIDIVIDSYAALKSGLSDNKIRALASTGSKRSEYLPDVPTAQEAGVAGYETTSWNALYAPAGVPAPVTELLNRGLGEVLAEPDVKRRLLDLGIEAKASSPAEINARMQADIQKWGQVIERAGIAKQ